MRPSIKTSRWGLWLVIAGCVPPGEHEDGPSTYWRDAKPILDANCTSCHTSATEGIAPFDLSTYAGAAALAPLVVAAVDAGSMPPWPPAAGCNSYLGERHVSEDDAETLRRWAEDDAPEGNTAEAGAPVASNELGLSRVDTTLQMPRSYTPEIRPDDNRCFVIDWPAEYVDDVFVTGSAVVPGNRAIVHHATVYLVPPTARAHYEALDSADEGPGYACFGEAGGPTLGHLAIWTPGDTGTEFPPGVGLRVPPGSQVVLQVHYNTLEAEATGDRTEVQLRVEPSVTDPALMLGVFDPVWVQPGGFEIPRSEADVPFRFSLDPRSLPGQEELASLSVHQAQLHMHRFGSAASVSLRHPDGSEECILAIDPWDVDWQGAYLLQEPVKWRPGDTFDVECRYDNSESNQPIIDGRPRPSINVNWGSGSLQEMCIAALLVTL